MDQWSETGDGGGAGGGGGYFNENGFGTQGAQSASKQVARQQFLCPVTVRQVLEAPEEGLKVGTLTASMVTLCGIATSVDVTSTNIKFTLSDDTGVIDCLEWLESEDASEARSPTNIIENAYYQVFGCVKSPQGKRRIMVFKVSPMEDLNEYTAFMAEVLSVHQYAQRVSDTTSMDVPITNNFANIPKRENGAPADDNRTAFTPIQRAVFEAIKAVEGQIGWDKNNDPVLRSKFSAKQIEDALDFLIGEGHIYSTVDDDHYCST